MVAFMNRESLKKTLATGQTWFWSRGRQELWWKGATSGHFQEVQEIVADCDYDCLLVRVDQVGGIACHEGVPSCFHNPVTQSGEPDLSVFRPKERRGSAAVPEAASGSAHGAAAAREAGGEGVLEELDRVIRDRQAAPEADSYTSRLFRAGLDRICRKVGEEATETIIAAKNGVPDELAGEAADLLYHLQVLLAAGGVAWADVLAELSHRRSDGHGGDGHGGERPKTTL
jgi:phosphoribosyl-ATP pyrophosphohydrolase/phosphoribosyl-AMP cyclohydrolase